MKATGIYRMKKYGTWKPFEVEIPSRVADVSTKDANEMKKASNHVLKELSKMNDYKKVHEFKIQKFK